MREMKDSEIEWIGKIPKEWTLKKIKYIASERNENAKMKADDKYIGLENVTSGKNEVSFSETEYLPSIQSVCKVNDVMFSKLRPYLNKVIICPYNCFCTSEFIVYKEFKGDIRFLRYFMTCDGFINTVTASTYGTKMPRANPGFINNLYICYCEKKEQIEIANYLDSKCSEIDAITADIQKEITVLEDYKKSIIYDTVSHGFTKNNTSEIHDGVWSNLPLGWKLVDIKYLFEIVKRIAGKEGYDILSVTQKGLRIKDITSNQGQLADDYSGYQLVYPTDYVMNHMDLLTGWVDCSKLFGVTSPDYRVFRLRNKADNSLAYYKYVMQCCYMNKIFYSLGQGVSNLGRWRLQTSAFNNFKVPVPPKSEQDEIADYLDSKCSEIEATIADKQKQLTVLANYKKSLIYEYVTGKKEVPCHE